MAVFSLALVSCSNDDGDNEVTSSIVGTWEVTERKVSSPYSIEDGLQVGERITSHSDGRYEEPHDTGKWSQEGNTLICTSDDDFLSIPGGWEILKLTDKVLEVRLDYGSFVQGKLKMKKV